MEIFQQFWWRPAVFIALTGGLLFGVTMGAILQAQPTEEDKDLLPVQPIALTLEPQKQIYTAREGLMVKFTFKALQPARVCFEKDPLTQFRFSVYRSGTGALPLQPVVTHDTRVLFDQRPEVFMLDSGEVHVYRLNLKRLHFRQGEAWTPGDYTVNATFSLCEQTEDKAWDASGKENPLGILQPARFMIMN